MPSVENAQEHPAAEVEPLVQESSPRGPNEVVLASLKRAASLQAAANQTQMAVRLSVKGQQSAAGQGHVVAQRQKEAAHELLH